MRSTPSFFWREPSQSVATSATCSRTLGTRCDQVGDVRGLGTMLAMEMVEDRETKKPAVKLTADIVARAREKGLIVIKAGVYGNVVRVLAPLSISREELEMGMEMLADATVEACRQ